MVSSVQQDCFIEVHLIGRLSPIVDFQVLEARKRTVAATFLKIIIMVMVTMVELKAGLRKSLWLQR